MRPLSPQAFVGAISPCLADSSLLQEAGIQLVRIALISDPESWPAQLEVHFLDRSATPYIWNAGLYDYVEIPGINRDVSDAEIELVIRDWCVVAAANLAEWVAVRDREAWESVRADTGSETGQAGRFEASREAEPRI